jgi:hypothetical protein
MPRLTKPMRSCYEPLNSTEHLRSELVDKHTVKPKDAENWIAIEELVAQHEEDPVMAQKLREARIRIAHLIYDEGDPRHARMLRGEGPPRDAHTSSEQPS